MLKYNGSRASKTCGSKNAAVGGGHSVIFVSRNDAPASAAISKLVGDLGFAPIFLGKLAEGGRLLERGGPLVLQNLIKQE